MASDLFVMDSNVFVSFYCRDDERHADAIRVMRELGGKLLVVHPYVIQETATVLMYKLGPIASRTFLNDITATFHINIPAVDIRYDIELFKKTNKKISLTDVVLVDLAHRMNAHLVTFDKDMLALFKSGSL